MSHIFDRIVIVGGGLIGSSIARAVRFFDVAKNVTIADPDEAVRSRLDILDIADHICDLNEALWNDADMVMLATPPSVMADVAQKILPHLKSGAILSDVGSIKGDIITKIRPFLPQNIAFVPGHPIAGTEKSGPDAGFAILFKDRWCVLTPEDERADAVVSMKKFWTALGSHVTIMSPERHDLVLATTSHVPHLIAYTLVNTAMDMETVTQNEVVKFSAGGFRDFTRIAASDPIMWRDICLQNRESILEIVDRFMEDLSALKRAIRWDDGDKLLEHFARTQDIRRRIIDAGQESSASNFGRDDPENSPDD